MKDKSGKFFERVVAQIEETLKLNIDFKIHHGIKLRDRDGIERQIDVMLEQNLDDRFKYLTLIECKDYERPIEVGTIGSFINLLESLPEVHQGFFVSKKGFQNSAVKKAQKYGKLKLLTLEEISDPNVFNHKAKQIKQIIQRYYLKQVGLEIPQEYKLNIITQPDNNLIGIEGVNDMFTREQLFERFLRSNINNQYLELWTNFYFNKNWTFAHKIKIKIPIYQEEKLFFYFNKRKISIQQIWAEYELWLEEHESNVISIQSYIDNDSKNEIASSVTCQLSDNNELSNFNIVRSKDEKRMEVFVNSKNGKTEKLVPLAVIDPEKGTFTKLT